MISERILSRHYASFWDELLPFGEKFVRVINLSYQRYDFSHEYDGHPDADIRAYVNELGFEFYALLHEQTAQNSYADIASLDTSSLEQQVAERINGLSSGSANVSSLLNPHNKKEAIELANATKAYFDSQHRAGNVRIKPRFVGCGFVDDCFGDVLVDTTLVEIKAGDRNFRSTDIRQLLVYAALNSVSQHMHLEDVALLNPRRGIFYRTSLQTLCVECSAQDSSTILSRIVNYVSETSVSK